MQSRSNHGLSAKRIICSCVAGIPLLFGSCVCLIIWRGRVHASPTAAHEAGVGLCRDHPCGGRETCSRLPTGRSLMMMARLLAQQLGSSHSPAGPFGVPPFTSRTALYTSSTLAQRHPSARYGKRPESARVYCAIEHQHSLGVVFTQGSFCLRHECAIVIYWTAAGELLPLTCSMKERVEQHSHLEVICQWSRQRTTAPLGPSPR